MPDTHLEYSVQKQIILPWKGGKNKRKADRISVTETSEGLSLRKEMVARKDL